MYEARCSGRRRWSSSRRLRTSASPHEIRLVGTTLKHGLTEELPEKQIGDKAYDSDALDEELAQLGIELIASHKRNRKEAKTQDGRKF